MRMPTDEYDILARVALFDAVNDIFFVSTRVRRLDSESKWKWGMWFSTTSAIYLEAVGLDLVRFHELLGLEGQRRREFPGQEVDRRQDGETY